MQCRAAVARISKLSAPSSPGYPRRTKTRLVHGSSSSTAGHTKHLIAGAHSIGCHVWLSVNRFKKRTANEVRRNVVWACARDAQTLTELHRLHEREHVRSVRGAISVGQR